MNITVSEILDFVEENDVKFVRLGFCDIFGAHKNISIMSSELRTVFENGVAIDATVIDGFKEKASELYLFPDPSTLMVLPWRPDPGRVVRFFCDIKYPGGAPFERDPRAILKNVLKKIESLGYICKIGAECEFYLFKTDDDGAPTYNTIDYGGYLDIAPLDKGENIRREICLNLEEMGLKPQCSHHEKGPGQNEIDFRYSDALNSADNLMTFKSVVKAIAARNGLFASFMPKPLKGKSGNGMHINMSLSQNGNNVFKNPEVGHSPIAESFIAGVLDKACDMTAFLNPIINSYERFGEMSAPSHVSWSGQNYSQLIRTPNASKERMRMELRSPDATLNPYIAYALIISAGLYGIENNLPLPPSVDFALAQPSEEELENLKPLPKSLSEALDTASGSDFIKSVIGEEMLRDYVNLKHGEIKACEKANDKEVFMTERYFNFF